MFRKLCNKIQTSSKGVEYFTNCTMYKLADTLSYKILLIATFWPHLLHKPTASPLQHEARDRRTLLTQTKGSNFGNARRRIIVFDCITGIAHKGRLLHCLDLEVAVFSSSQWSDCITVTGVGTGPKAPCDMTRVFANSGHALAARACIESKNTPAARPHFRCVGGLHKIAQYKQRILHSELHVHSPPLPPTPPCELCMQLAQVSGLSIGAPCRSCSVAALRWMGSRASVGPQAGQPHFPGA